MNVFNRNFLKIICTYFSVFLVLVNVGFATPQPFEVRKINPPRLSEKYLGKHILCHRPMRKESPMMYVEKNGDKIIAHNYGHGGSGWTLAPGATKYVVNLLKQKLEEENISKNEPIAVVGAGVLGLFSALDLLDQGYTDISILAEFFDNLASHNAGALLAPVSMDNSPDMQKLIDQIGVEAYKNYKDISEGRHPIFDKRGVLIVPAYFDTREESGLEPYVNVVMQPAKDVILDFQNGTTRKMVAYDDGIFINTDILMQNLKQALKDKVKFKKVKIDSFKNVKQKIILNCTGMGSKVMLNDDKMVSVQGHLIMLKDQNPQDINHMILVYFGKDKTKSNFKIKRSFYIFPKKLPESSNDDIGVIGGTFIEGADKNIPHEEEFKTMIKGAQKFYGIKD